MITFYIETYGCAHNTADSERMTGILQESNLQQVDAIQEADVIIFDGGNNDFSFIYFNKIYYFFIF